MNFEIIWRKIQEFAMWFFHFAMNEGENKFMLVDQNLLRVDKINTADNDDVFWDIFYCCADHYICDGFFSSI